MRLKIVLLSAFAAALPVVAACGHSAVAVQPDSVLPVQVDLAGSPVQTLTVTVTGPDMSGGVVFNLPLTNGQGSGEIHVPAGSDRTVTVRAFDARGIETLRGTTLVTLHEGANPPISLTLSPLEGTVTIAVTTGALNVSVGPTPDTVAVGDTLRLRATVRDGSGNAVASRVAWASGNPALATVDSTGLVRAVRQGTVKVYASSVAWAGAADVVVR